MLKSYLKVALRSLRKQKVVSAVTIGSLAVGLACCLLFFLYVRHEWTYDRFHEDADRIFRMVAVGEDAEGDTTLSAQTKAGLGEALEATFPEVETSVRLRRREVMPVASVGGAEVEESVLFADSTFLSVFDVPLRKGRRAGALVRPESAVLAAATAQRLFGEKNPVGQRLDIEFEEGTRAFEVRGVAEALPENSTLSFGVLLPFENLQYTFPEQFRSVLMERPLASTYVRLADASAAKELREKLGRFAEARDAEEGEITALRVQPLVNGHLSPEVRGGLATPSDPMYSYVLAGIALLVLALACINFTTLSLGRSLGRAREVGVRKAVGALREQVAAQFWGEAFLTTGLALVLSVVLARAALPVFERLTQTTLSFSFFATPSLLLSLTGLLLTVGLVAGAYPALLLSGSAPTAVLRGGNSLASGGRSRFVRTLVAVQFALSIALVAGALIVAEQLRFATEMDLGFEKEHLVVINSGGSSSDVGESYEAFRQEAKRIAGVRSMASTFSSFGDGKFADTSVETPPGRGDASVNVDVNYISSGYLETLQIELRQGYTLDDERASERDVLVNEAFVRAMDWDAPLGKQIPSASGSGFASIVLKNRTVAGVVEDFHTASVRQSIAPTVLLPSAASGGAYDVAVRIVPKRARRTLDRLRETWAAVAPAGTPFEVAFVDEIVRAQYETERRWQAIVRYAAALALLISCAGLFGLALLAVQRRAKEIGIRKVMGASAWNVTALVARQFAWLVAVGFALAVPLAWFGARRWLETFAYRIDLSAGPFLAAGAAVLVVAMATVGYQALRAARANPVEAIRQE